MSRGPWPDRYLVVKERETARVPTVLLEPLVEPNHERRSEGFNHAILAWMEVTVSLPSTIALATTEILL